MGIKGSCNEVNSVFEQPWWLDIVAGSLWREIIIQNKNGDCIGRLPYMHSKQKFMNLCTVPPLTQQVGPWINVDSRMKRVAKLKHIKKVSEELIDRLSHYENVDLYFNKRYEYVLPFIWAGYSVEPRFTYVIDNLENLDLVKANMESKVRNLIKNAQKSIVVKDFISDDDLLRLLELTFAKQGRKLPLDKTMVVRLVRESVERQSGKVFCAEDLSTGEAVAVAFFVYDKNTCYYLLGGRDYSSKICGCQELLLWHGIQFAATVSMEFDFEGSMIPGIESFFRGFGGNPRTYFRVYRGGIYFRFLNYLKPHIKKILNYK